VEETSFHFNNNSQVYNEIRPGYPNEIYEIISEYRAFDKNSNILEIGAGNGIASQEIYNKWQSKLTLIEPGNNLCKILYGKFNDNKNIEIVNTLFEKYQNKILYDGIISATAFHWLELETKYKKSHELLKDDGLLILYWNNYSIESNEMNNDIQKIYTKNGSQMAGGKSIYEKQMEKIDNRKKEIEESKYFEIVEHKIIQWIKGYNSEGYIKLLNTFPDHSKYEKEFFDNIGEIIIKNGNKINIKIIVNLEIAKKICKNGYVA
jgi:hypothetical protein